MIVKSDLVGLSQLVQGKECFLVLEAFILLLHESLIFGEGHQTPQDLIACFPFLSKRKQTFSDLLLHELSLTLDLSGTRALAW